MPLTAACHQWDGDPEGCLRAWHINRDWEPSPCVYDEGAANCHGCGPDRVDAGECVNTCLQ